MRWSPTESFRFHIAVVAIAAISVTALAIVLVRDAVTSAERTLAAEARQQCLSAAQELRRQYEERAAFQDDEVRPLPLEALDLSLRGLSAAVLRSYEGVIGGFWLETAGAFVGAPEPPAAESIELIERLIEQTAGEDPQTADLGVRSDLLAAAAAPTAGGEAVAWALKRLPAVRDPAGERRRWWLAGLVVSALLSLGGVASISIRLRRGAEQIRRGLGEMENDFRRRLPGLDGEFGEIAAAINQMAERRLTLEATLRRQDRLAALGKVVSGVAHEIRNPLNSLRLTLELLERRIRKNAVRGDEIGGVLEEVDRLDRILARLLAFGKADLSDRRPQDLLPLLERALRMAGEPAQRKRVELVMTGAAPASADVDGLQIEQVLINLLLNAVEASPRGGRVETGLERLNGAIELWVRDHGPGVPPEIRDHIFDPYFTTKETGNGLGLSVSREVAARHGGSLEFSCDGDGATFRLRLPATAGESP